jgi:hypothetical protein
MVLDLTRISAPVRALLHRMEDGNSAFGLLAEDHGRFPGIRPSELEITSDCRWPKEALAGLLLYAGFADASHNVSQSCSSKEGIYWHGIYHRLEPDEWNSMYWLRQAGQHAICGDLARAAAKVGFGKADAWNHQAFVDFTKRARESGSAKDQEIARQVQLAEWQLLFAYCAESVGREGTQSR